MNICIVHQDEKELYFKKEAKIAKHLYQISISTETKHHQHPKYKNETIISKLNYKLEAKS